MKVNTKIRLLFLFFLFQMIQLNFAKILLEKNKGLYTVFANIGEYPQDYMDEQDSDDDMHNDATDDIDSSVGEKEKSTKVRAGSLTQVERNITQKESYHTERNQRNNTFPQKRNTSHSLLKIHATLDKMASALSGIHTSLNTLAANKNTNSSITETQVKPRLKRNINETLNEISNKTTNEFRENTVGQQAQQDPQSQSQPQSQNQPQTQTQAQSQENPPYYLPKLGNNVPRTEIYNGITLPPGRVIAATVPSSTVCLTCPSVVATVPTVVPTVQTVTTVFPTVPTVTSVFPTVPTVTSVFPTVPTVTTVFPTVPRIVPAPEPSIFVRRNLRISPLDSLTAVSRMPSAAYNLEITGKNRAIISSMDMRVPRVRVISETPVLASNRMSISATLNPVIPPPPGPVPFASRVSIPVGNPSRIVSPVVFA